VANPLLEGVVVLSGVSGVTEVVGPSGVGGAVPLLGVVVVAGAEGPPEECPHDVTNPIKNWVTSLTEKILHRDEIDSRKVIVTNSDTFEDICRVP